MKLVQWNQLYRNVPFFAKLHQRCGLHLSAFRKGARHNRACIPHTLSCDSLRSMESDGIVTRTVYPEVPPRVEYALSELGESMRPIMKAMEAWGQAYKKQCE